MSEESPPTYTTSIFNQANFGTAAEGLDTAYLNSHYLKYPTAQTGLETIANLATTNDATINGLTVGTGAGTGIENTAVGDGALASATTAAQNTAVGHEALYATTTSGTQTAVGFHAARNATGTNNLAIGYRALRGVAGTNTGTYNVAVGVDALFSITSGTLNTAVGYKALTSHTTGASNTAIGYQALTANIGGNNNTAVGVSSLTANSGANNNTAIGAAALASTTSGGNNTAIGYQAGFAGTANTTGTNNTYIGHEAQANGSGYTKSTALGSGAIITASNQVVLGTTTETVVIPRITRYLTPNVYTRRANAVQTLPNNSDTKVIFDGLDGNSSGYTGLTYSSGTFTNSNSYSIGVNISAFVVISGNANNFRAAFILSGGVRYGQAVALPCGATETPVLTVSCNLVLTSGATFEIYGWQNSGSSLTFSTVAGAYSTVSIMVF